MDVTWYLVLSALLFAIGACGVLHPPQPAGDPALPRADAERRQPRPGRLLALERRRGGPDLRADRDGRRRLRGRRRPRPDRRDVPAPAAARRRRDPGAARDERDDLGLAGPRLPARRQHGDRLRPRGDARAGAGLGRHRRDRARLRLLDRRAARAARPPGRRAPAHRLALQLRLGGRARHPARHPGRPALGLHVPGGHRGLDPDPPLLGRLHGLRPRLRALLLLPQLLRLLDAAAGPGRQLRPADRRLGVRRLRLLRADQLLVPARDRDQGRDEGVRDQRRRRHRPRARRVLRLPRARHLRLPASLRRRPRDASPPTRAS